MKHLEGLNSPQKEAVETIDGPVLVVAGAGAGKTRVITHRIAHIISTGVEPHNILAVTFTNKAAKEMRERVNALLAQDMSSGRTPFVSTFHALGVYLLRAHRRELDIPLHFAIFDRDDSKKAVRDALKKRGIDPKQYDPGKILNSISKQKGEAITAEEFEGIATNYWDELVSEVWLEYEKTLVKSKAFDFDDLLLKTMIFLRDNPEITKKYNNLWKYIHVDEYQDTNKVQYELIKLLCNDDNNICVVGDADQTIYTWRGANIKNILSFEKDFEGAKTILLEENYRSTQNILGAANDIIKKNSARIDKKLFTQNTEGEKLELIEGWNEANEAERITARIQDLIREGSSPKEIAILYRANFQSRVLEEALLRERVPYQLVGTKFFERKEVKDMLSYIRAALNPDNLTDIARVINNPARGIGKVTLAKVIEGKREELSGRAADSVTIFYNILARIREKSKTAPPSELVKYTLKQSGFDTHLKGQGDDGLERLENIQELASLASKYNHLPPEEGVGELLSDAALATDQDNVSSTDDSVKLMTVHASKGLEFDYVFISGLEAGLFPHERLDSKGVDSEEERRLFYVALTRARKKAFLSFAHTRTVFGNTDMRAPSEFISDIDEAFLEKAESSVNQDIDSQRKRGIDAIFDIDF